MISCSSPREQQSGKPAGGAGEKSPGITEGAPALFRAELNREWKFREEGKERWLPAEVPGCVHTDLLAAGEIPDPFFGANEKELQWIGKRGWEYETLFSPDSLLSAEETDSSPKACSFGPAAGCRRAALVFKGLDTFTEVYLNGGLILKTDNMFREWRVDCTDGLIDGVNRLKIVFRPPAGGIEEAREKLGYTLPGGGRAFVRKAQYQFGWDWAPRFLTAGIWRPVYLEVWDTARIENIHIIQKKLAKDKAVISAEVSVETASGGRFEVLAVELETGEEYAAKTGKYEAGSIKVPLEFEIRDPELWWPNGLGRQRMYHFVFAVIENNRLLDREDVGFGIRTVELVTEPDLQGESFYFKINGVPVFMKGANYVPQDNFPSRAGPESYRRLIASAKDANMNMLRVWGGGIYEDDGFYDLCDENGILIWQDFMFACGMYPWDACFLENVKEEAEDVIKRLRNHPCVALWCGNNENEEGWKNWGWQKSFGYSEDDSAAIWQGYEALFRELLPDVVTRLDGTRPYVPSSPRYGRGDPRSLSEGDLHYWGVWHDGEPFSVLDEKTGRFMSEFGFQSYPHAATLNSFLPREEMISSSSSRVDGYDSEGGYGLKGENEHGAAEDPRHHHHDHGNLEFRTIRNDIIYTGGPRFDSPYLLAHQKHSRGNELITAYMERDYPVPDKFGHFVYVSQLLQAEGLKRGIEAQRRAKPRCMGSLYWQLNDSWPAVSWSSIDYFGRRKALHYYAKKAFAPVLVSPAVEGDSTFIYIVSDGRQVIEGILRLKIIDFTSNILWRKNIKVSVPPGSSDIYFSIGHRSLLPRADSRNYLLFCELGRGPDVIASNILYYHPPKELMLPEPELHARAYKTRGGYRIILTAHYLVKNLYIQLEEDSRAFPQGHAESSADASFPPQEHFSDNFFDIPPNGRVEVILYTERDFVDLEKQLRFSSLTDIFEDR